MITQVSLSLYLKTVKGVADVISEGRLFQKRGTPTAKARSPTGNSSGDLNNNER